jgi:hypothetical protein
MSKTKITWAAIVAVAALAACSDPTASPVASKLSGQPLFAVGDPTTSTPLPGQLKVCKTGNVSGTFSVTKVAVNGGVGTAQNPLTVAPADPCRIAGADAGGSGVGTDFTLTEGAAPANTVQSVVSCVTVVEGTLGTCALTNGQEFFINSIHGIVITYNNVFTPPSTGCTFTKGWYRNNGSSTVIGVDGRTKAQAQAIFNATPGQPGSVTWPAGRNDILNLYQQLLTALNNLGGDANALDGPPALDAAITAALAGTGGAGTAITSNLTVAQASTLINALTFFNEGNVTGWPHCDD